VRPHVHGEAAGLREGLAAFEASIWSFSRMQPDVRSQLVC